MKSLDLLKSHCVFDSPYDVYILLAVARKKNNIDITNSQEIVFREIIKKPEEIERKYSKIKTLTENYRDSEGREYSFYTYVSVNPRNSMKAFFLLQNRFNTTLSEALSGVDVSLKFKRIGGLWMSALANPNCRGSRKSFMVDLDTKDPDQLDYVFKELSKHTKTELVVETKNGYHILVKPFNRTKFDIIGIDLEIKTDALLFVEYKNKGEKKNDK